MSDQLSAATALSDGRRGSGARRQLVGLLQSVFGPSHRLPTWLERSQKHERMRMAHSEVMPSREFGLAIGLILGRYCLKMEDLHYGYWTEELPVEIQNLPKAQAQYTEELLSVIPDGVQTILDVGCGGGNTARKLLDRGYQVEGVSPNPQLTKAALDLLGDGFAVHECRYEDLKTDRKYDLILFSESFLFIRPIEAGIEKSIALLNEGGHILIADVFRNTPERGPIGGGHQMTDFVETFSRSQFTLLKERDVTSNISPTFTVLDDAYKHCIHPVYELVLARLKAKFPWTMKFLLWKFRDKIAKYESKHFSGQRTAENFERYKSYRFFLYQKRSGPALD